MKTEKEQTEDVERTIKEPRRKEGTSLRRTTHRVGPYGEDRVMRIRIAAKNAGVFGVMPEESRFLLYNAPECGTPKENRDGESKPVELDMGKAGVANFVQLGLGKGEYLVVVAMWKPILLEVEYEVRTVEKRRKQDFLSTEPS